MTSQLYYPKLQVQVQQQEGKTPLIVRQRETTNRRINDTAKSATTTSTTIFHHVAIIVACCFVFFYSPATAAAAVAAITPPPSWTIATTTTTNARYRRNARLLRSSRLFRKSSSNSMQQDDDFLLLHDRLQELRGGAVGPGRPAAGSATAAAENRTKQQQQRPLSSASTAATTSRTRQTGQQQRSGSSKKSSVGATSSSATNTVDATMATASSTTASPPPSPPPPTTTTSTTTVATATADTTVATTDTTTTTTVVQETAATTPGALIQNDAATNTSLSSPSSSSSVVAESSSSVPPEQEVKQEVKQKEEKKEDPRVMFLIRLLFLSYYGSLGSLMPFLPVYYHSLGHGGQVIGMLGAVKPFTTFLVAPLWGLISDEAQCPFLILQITFVVSLIGQLLVGVRHEAWYITSMVFLTAVFNAPVKSLIDSMVLDHIVDRSSYGRLRLWGQMGFGLGSSCVGLVLSKSSTSPPEWHDITNKFSPYFENHILSKLSKPLQSAVRYTDKCWQSITGYKLLFMTYAVLSIPSYLCVQAFRRLDAEKKKTVQIQPLVEESSSQQGEMTTTTSTAANVASNNADANATATAVAEPERTSIGQGLVLLSQNTDALLFFFLIFCVGISSGIIENFAYVRIREVGGSGKEMGLSRLVSSLAGAPMFWFSGALTNKFGVDRILVVSLLSYITRFVIYAAMQNPYQGLPAEALRGVTFAAFWSSATIYAHKVSPVGLHATMLMLLNAMYGGLGQSMGALLGGKMQHAFGTVWTFLYAALMDLALVGIMIVYLGTRNGTTSFHNPTPIVDTRSTAATTATITSNNTILHDGTKS